MVTSVSFSTNDANVIALRRWVSDRYIAKPANVWSGLAQSLSCECNSHDVRRGNEEREHLIADQRATWPSAVLESDFRRWFRCSFLTSRFLHSRRIRQLSSAKRSDRFQSSTSILGRYYERVHRRKPTRSRQFASYFWTDLIQSRFAKSVWTFNCENSELYPKNSEWRRVR